MTGVSAGVAAGIATITGGRVNPSQVSCGKILVDFLHAPRVMEEHLVDALLLGGHQAELVRSAHAALRGAACPARAGFGRPVRLPSANREGGKQPCHPAAGALATADVRRIDRRREFLELGAALFAAVLVDRHRVSLTPTSPFA